MSNMKTAETTPISAEIMAELIEAAKRAAKGVRDPQVMRSACDRMDKLREKIFQREGLLDIGVPAIREFRDRE
jgi:hypothetical protein